MPLPTACVDCDGPLRREAAIAIFVHGDEYIYTYLACTSCTRYTIEAYHDRFMGDDSVTILPTIPAERGRWCVAWIGRCPEPASKWCDCDAHRALYTGLCDRPPPAAASSDPS